VKGNDKDSGKMAEVSCCCEREMKNDAVTEMVSFVGIEVRQKGGRTIYSD
jgi:hypothetical protein